MTRHNLHELLDLMAGNAVQDWRFGAFFAARPQEGGTEQEEAETHPDDGGTEKDGAERDG